MGNDIWADSRMTSLRMVAYEGSGAAVASVVVLHGLGTSVDILRESVPQFDPVRDLATQGVNVLALDWPGHGRSGGSRGHLSYRGAMEAVATAVDVSLRRWDAPVVLLGVALGGTLASYAAIEDDRIHAVAAHGLMNLRDIGPVLQRRRQRAVLPVAGRLHRMLGDHSNRYVPMPLSAIMSPSDLAFDPRLAARLVQHPQSVRTYDLQALGSILLSPEDKPSLAALTTPTLVLVGSEDSVIPATATHAAASQISGPVETWVLPGAGHQLLLEHYQAFIPRVGRFVHERLGSTQAGEDTVRV